MSGFKASEALEPMDWDFRPYVDADGRTPEPAQDVLDRFRRGWSDMVGAELDEEGKVDTAKVKQIISDAGGAEAYDRKSSEQVLDLYADVCQGSPSREQIEGLPATIRRKFYNDWWQALLDPTSRTPATKP